MAGSCIIDGTDIATLGAFILRGGDYDFLTYPARKEPMQNNWFEMDGAEVDLSEIYFNEKTVSVGFHIMGESGADFDTKLSQFYAVLSVPGYRELYSREFDRTFFLRFVQVSSYEHTGGLYKQGKKSANITVEFSMDDPLQLFTRPAILTPVNGRRSPAYVEINGIDLSAFGIIVNQCYNSVLRLPNPKQILVRSFEQRTGAIASFPSRITLEKKQITIECTMTADNREDFYYNYEALFNNLTLLKEINVSTFSSEMKCYYSDMQGFEKIRPFSSGIMVGFSLVLTQVNTNIFEQVLGTERGEILTANNTNLIKIY